jgi:hypothetical protein
MRKRLHLNTTENRANLIQRNVSRLSQERSKETGEQNNLFWEAKMDVNSIFNSQLPKLGVVTRISKQWGVEQPVER